MKTVVTGASGHIGCNLCRRLMAAGYAVRAQYLTYPRSLEGLDLELRCGDVRDGGFVRSLVEGADVVFHLAARISISGDPDGVVRQTNVEGTRHVAEACLGSGVGRLVHFSSIHAFRQLPSDEPLDESRKRVGRDSFAYDRSKAAGEEAVRDAASRGLSAVILNPTAVIGPADYRPSAMGRVLQALAAGRMPVLVKGGFDWVDVRDVVGAALAAISRGDSGQNYLLSGGWASMKEVALMVDDAVGARRRRVVVPVWIARASLPAARLAAALSGVSPVFTTESLTIVSEGNRFVRNDRATRELGFRARPLHETIRDTLMWFHR